MITVANPLLVSESEKVGRLCLYWDEYRSQTFLHIRYFFRNRKTGEWEPGVKGIAIPEHNVAKFLEGLREVLESAHDEEGEEEIGGSGSGRPDAPACPYD